MSRSQGIGWAVALWLLASTAQGQGVRPLAVEPADLTNRKDLVGKEVVVDDRGGFQYHNENRAFDAINLRRAPDVQFKLPQRLWLKSSPPSSAVKVQGVLRHDANGWWVAVTSYEPLPTDIDRLGRAVAQLGRTDTEGREAWARWGLRRAEEFGKLARQREPNKPTGEEALLARSREILADIIRQEGDRPPVKDADKYWLALAQRARGDALAEPEPSSQAHRGFRAALAATSTADGLAQLVSKIEAFFPSAPKPTANAPDLAKWEKAYNANPADGYRAADPATRLALDHRLWADATQKRLQKRAADDPKSILSLAEDASRLLPDRPQFAAGLVEKGLSDAEGDVGKLRQAEVDSLAATYRDQLHQPERAIALYKAWLDDQKERRLSPRDAEGRIALADQYKTLLDDRSTAVTLLRDAWKIDPGSREVADAFRRYGFKKENERWVELARPKSADVAAAAEKVADASLPDLPAAAPGRSATDSLLNLTADAVRTRMNGKPDRKVLVATQGQVIEQWIYVLPKQFVYINFVRQPTDPRLHVVSRYSVPRLPRGR